MNNTFVIDNFSITSSLLTNSIHIKVVNITSYVSYETVVNESSITDKKYKLDDLYIFFMKCFQKEENHKYIIQVQPNNLKISMEAVFNTYFHMSHELLFNKKLLSNEEIMSNVVIKQDKKIEELEKRVDTLESLLLLSEISIGCSIDETNHHSIILVSIGMDEINTLCFINPNIYMYAKHIIYFSKIKSLTKLKKIIFFQKSQILLYDLSTNSILNIELLIEYCTTNNIEIIFKN
jgi:hypothetical protein